MKLIHNSQLSTKKEKRTKKERNGCGYSFNSFCPTKRTHPTVLVIDHMKGGTDEFGRDKPLILEGEDTNTIESRRYVDSLPQEKRDYLMNYLRILEEKYLQ